MNNYREFAISLALKAGDIMKRNFILGMHKEWKEDDSPLTAADLAINDLVIAEVKKQFPGHGIIAEEGSSFNNEEYVWICDPVDGTTPFSRGYPTFLFSLALVRYGQPILGVLYDPILDRLVVAESGGGAYLNGNIKLQVDESPEFTRSIVALEADKSELRGKLIRNKHCLVTTFACISYSSLLVAFGQFRAVLWFGKTPWDGAAVQIVVEESGGICTDVNGAKQRYDGPINGIVASNKTVHPILIDMIQQEKALE